MEDENAEIKKLQQTKDDSFFKMMEAEIDMLAEEKLEFSDTEESYEKNEENPGGGKKNSKI